MQIVNQIRVKMSSKKCQKLEKLAKSSLFQLGIGFQLGFS